MLKKLFLTQFFVLACLSAGHANDRIYIDSEELDSTEDAFRIHIGENVWIETNTVHRDVSGLYTFEDSIARSIDVKTGVMQREKSWKCPYCYRYWPVGKPCGNPECPSKYPDKDKK